MTDGVSTTTTARNEAAERLIEMLPDYGPGAATNRWEEHLQKYRDQLDAALAFEVERHAPIMADHPMWVERRICNSPGCGDEDYFEHVAALLDELEAQR